MGAGRSFNDGQEIVIDDFNGITAAVERQTFGRLAHHMAGRQSFGFFNDSFAPSYVAANSVLIKRGLGIYSDFTIAAPETQVKPVNLTLDQTLTLPAADASLPRIDIIVAAPAIATDLQATRNYKDPSSGAISQQSLVVQKDWVASLQVVKGVAASTPVAPTVPAGFIIVATLAITAVVGLASAAAVTDSRAVLPLNQFAQLNTSLFKRLTAGTGVSFSQLFTDTDAALTAGRQTWTDFEQQDDALTLSEPASPIANRVRLFFRNGQFVLKNSSGVKQILNTPVTQLLMLTVAETPAYVITAADHNKIFSLTTSNMTTSPNYNFTLPTTGLFAGFRFTVIDNAGLLSQLITATLNLSAGIKIQGIASTTYVMQAPYGSWTFVYDGTNWTSV